MKKRLLVTGAVLAALLAALALELSYEKTRCAARAIVPSPDCEMLAFVLERRDGVKRSADLQAYSKLSSDRRPIPLTYEIAEVVQSPDPSVIAFIVKSVGGTRDRYDVFAMDNALDTAAASGSLEAHAMVHFADTKDIHAAKSGLQFSKDGNYLRYKTMSMDEPDEINGDLSFYALERFELAGQRIANMVRQGAFKYKYNGMRGNSLYARPSRVQWRPPKKPDKLPAFMTARQPKIHAGTLPAWAPDSKTLYVHDKEGVWSAEINSAVGLAEWRLILPVRKLRAFQIAPDGDSLLMERGVKRRLELVNLKGDPQPQLVGEGRGACFSPDRKRIAFINKNGAFIADIQGGEPRPVGGGINGQPKIQRNSRLQWSHDSRLLYVHDAEGVWSIEPDGEPDGKKSGWTLIAKAEGLHTYRIVHRENRPRFLPENGEEPVISNDAYLLMEMEAAPNLSIPDGKGGFVLLPLRKSEHYHDGELGSKRLPRFISGRLKERHLATANLSSGDPEPYYDGKGWEVGFRDASYGGDSWHFFANYNGLYAMKVEGWCGLGHILRYDE